MFIAFYMGGLGGFCRKTNISCVLANKMKIPANKLDIMANKMDYSSNKLIKIANMPNRFHSASYCLAVYFDKNGSAVPISMP